MWPPDEGQTTFVQAIDTVNIDGGEETRRTKGAAPAG
jgi:hypothetical protein